MKTQFNETGRGQVRRSRAQFLKSRRARFWASVGTWPDASRPLWGLALSHPPTSRAGQRPREHQVKGTNCRWPWGHRFWWITRPRGVHVSDAGPRPQGLAVDPRPRGGCGVRPWWLCRVLTGYRGCSSWRDGWLGPPLCSSSWPPLPCTPGTQGHCPAPHSCRSHERGHRC